MALLARCDDAGIAPVVAAPMEGVFLDRLRTAGYEVAVVEQPARLNRYGGALYRDGPAARWRSATDAIGYIARVRRWLRRQRFDALYCNDMRALLTFGVAARTLGVPVLTWDKLDKPHGWLDAVQLPLTNRNLVISEAVTKKYPAWQRRWWRRRIRRIFDGIDLARYAEAVAPRAPLPETNGAIVVAVAGSVTPRKGQDLLIDAFGDARKRVPELELWIIGDALGEDDRAFRDRLQERPGNDGVHWLGFRDDMPAVLQRIDILASPSRYEGMGRVNVEAMAAGKPVVGAAGTGIAEVVVDGTTGVLVDPGDTAALGDAVAGLAIDRDRREAFGAAARRRAADQFDQDKQVMKVLRELRDVADQKT